MYVPQVLGTAVSNWATPLGFGNMTAIPTPGQMVHAYFLGGDINHPVYACINLSTVNSDVTTINNSIASTNSNVTTIQGQISTLDTDVSTLQSDITSIQNSISDLTPSAWQEATLQSGVSGSGSGVDGIWYRTIPLGGMVELMGDIESSSTGNIVAAYIDVGDAYTSPIPENQPAGWNDTFNYTNSDSVTAASPPWIYVYQYTSDTIAVQLTGYEVADKEVFFHIFVHGDSLS